ncbi:hypothetical protein GGR52DRAFT_576397 [Hypoxylon sp. FL1284]|nr:hypothetical protein GGR52DRAFT_576397 [Hypoxylon sp. FL1284]
MASFPAEILLHILDYLVVACYNDKNGLLQLRTTCRLFDEALRPYVLKTLQLDYTRLDRGYRVQKPLDNDAFRRIGPLCQALYVDMMVVRDDSEVTTLNEMCWASEELTAFVEDLRDHWSLSEGSFTELDYSRQLSWMLRHAPNVAAVKLSLPLSSVMVDECRASTLILGNTFAALAKRLPADDEEEGEEHEHVEELRSLALENVPIVSFTSLWRNPQDVKNIRLAFRDLRHLFVSVRVDREWVPHCMWEMIGSAAELESLCIADTTDPEEEDEDEDEKTSGEADGSGRGGGGGGAVRWARDPDVYAWIMRCLPDIYGPRPQLPRLTSLELRRVRLYGGGLATILRSFGPTLRELRLDRVYLKRQSDEQALWIGAPNARLRHRTPRVAACVRLACPRLRVCRVSRIGYDHYDVDPRRARAYDLADPCGLSRSLEERFLEVVWGVPQPPAPDGSPVVYYPQEKLQDVWPSWQDEELATAVGDGAGDWHVRASDPASDCQRAIDGLFPNRNQYTLDALSSFAEVASRGMALVREYLRNEVP